MKNYIITENGFDKKIIEKILPKNILSHTKLIESGGYSSAVSLARSVFLNGDAKVLLLLDAGTTDEDEIEKKEDFIINYFNLISSDSEYKILYFIPGIEELFFIDKNFIEKTFMIQINEFEFEILKNDPKSSLKKISKNDDYRKIIFNNINNLSDETITKIQKTNIVDEIIKYSSKN